MRVSGGYSGITELGKGWKEMVNSIRVMSEEEMREELIRIRGERAGRGRIRKKQARTKRMDKVQKESRSRKKIEEMENAEWV